MSAEDLSSNPLCMESQFLYKSPNFPAIKIEHFKPAILEGMRIQLANIKKITDNTDVPTFENTILALELSDDLYEKARNILGNLSNSDSNDEIMALEDELTPLYSNHSDDIYLNEVLFQRVDTIFNQLQNAKPDDFPHLTPEDRRLVEVYHNNFILAGAKLDTAGKAKMREYNELLSSLENKFSQNLIKITQNDGIVITDLKRLDGLTQDEIEAAAALAKERHLPEGSYVLSLVNTTRNPLLCNLNDRKVRQELFECSTKRGFDGEYAQTDIVYQILTTRAKVAELLGFPNYSSYQLSNQMAKNPANALAMLTSTVPNVLKNVACECEAITKRLQKDLLSNDDAEQQVQAWDWEYYAEKVRADEFNVDPTTLREYFLFENVIEHGVFYTLNLLFGITFQKRTDIPTQHNDITVYEVFDADGTSLALFHADYFKRSSKSGGAWMSEWVSVNGERQQKSVTINNMNIVKSNENTFLTLDEASTAFHELGHGLHAIFSQARHRSLAGTNTSVDYVEFPSTTLEDWAIHPQILDNYAKHYKTGEKISADELQRVILSSKFNQGFETLEYVTAALIDLEWHNLSSDELATHFGKFGDDKAAAIQAFEKEILQKHGAYCSYVPPRYKTQYFNHSMTSYSASYYAYLWSELIAADCFRYITEFAPTPGPNRANGDKLRQECYATGNTRDLMAGYIAFRGQAPTSDALLLRRGLSVQDDTPKQ